MNEQLILEKLDRLTAEVKSLKSDVFWELKQDLEPIVKQAGPGINEFLEDIEGGYSNEKLVNLSKTVLSSLEELNEVVTAAKAGVELRDDLLVVLRLFYPRLLRFLNSLHEGEFQAEKVGDLLHTILINIHTLSDLLNIIQPVTELIKELGVLVKETDVIGGVNIWLDGLQKGGGLLKLSGVIVAFIKKIECDESQVEHICRTINDLDFSTVKPVGPIGIIKQINDPQVQEALGFIFTLLQAVGSCMQGCRAKGGCQAAV